MAAILRALSQAFWNVMGSGIIIYLSLVVMLGETIVKAQNRFPLGLPCWASSREVSILIMRIRIIKHEAVPECGSFEVRFPDGRPSVYFYWEDNPGRRLRPEQVDQETAKRQAQEFARAERDKP